ncbi:MAG: hypothetical protein AABY68_13185 [Pseudomonadota bacterium]
MKLIAVMVPFSFGLVSTINVNLVGTVSLGEVISMSLFMLAVQRAQLNRIDMQILGVALFWALAQLASDLVNESPAHLMLKGVFAPLIFVPSIIGLYKYFQGDAQRFPLFMIAALSYQIISLVLFPPSAAVSIFFAGNAWKFGYGAPTLFLIAIIFSYYKKSHPLMIAAVICYCLYSVKHDWREMAINPILAMCVYFYAQRAHDGPLIRYLRGGFPFFKFLLIFIPAVFILNSVLTVAFRSEAVLSVLSEESARKYKAQAAGDYGVLPGARSEMVPEIQAFLDAPLLGHGSWAIDKGNEYGKLFEVWRYRHGYTGDQGMEDFSWVGMYVKENIIPVHSYILSAMVWFGFSGFFVWAFFANLYLRFYFIDFHRLPFYYHMIAFVFFWNLLFSPFSGQGRWSTAIMMAAVLSARSRLLAGSQTGSVTFSK